MMDPSDASYVVIRGAADPAFEGHWQSRDVLRSILKNPQKEHGGFWVGGPGQPVTWVWPMQETETREDGAVAQVCRPRPEGHDAK